MKPFPETNTLTKHLSAMMTKSDNPIKIISRNSFYESSTFPVEIVTCKTADGKNISLFCKYLGGMGPNNYGHRGGVEYEAKVYSRILNKTSISKIKYFGQCKISDTDDALLVLEYIGETLCLHYSADLDAWEKAAEWAGKFHNYFDGKAPAFVKVYNKEYYYIWLERFKKLTYKHQENNYWLKGLLKYFEDHIEILIAGNQTIIHGEYYPKNILLKEGIIYPVDWESAAIAPGEIDLASLIEGLGKEIIENTKTVYKKARWPLGIISDDEFEKRLLMARIYFHFWWWPENSDALNLNESEEFLQLYQLSKEVSVV